MRYRVSKLIDGGSTGKENDEINGNCVDVQGFGPLGYIRKLQSTSTVYDDIRVPPDYSLGFSLPRRTLLRGTEGARTKDSWEIDYTNQVILLRRP